MVIRNTKYTDISTKQTQKAQRKQPKVTLTPDEQLKILSKKSTEALKGMVEEHVPEKGKLHQKVSVSFDVPATNNCTSILVEESADNNLENRDLIVGVRHKLRDRQISRFLLTQKSKQDIINYLKNTDSQAEIIKNIKDLSDKTDDYYNSL